MTLTLWYILVIGLQLVDCTSGYNGVKLCLGFSACDQAPNVNDIPHFGNRDALEFVTDAATAYTVINTRYVGVDFVMPSESTCDKLGTCFISLCQNGNCASADALSSCVPVPPGFYTTFTGSPPPLKSWKCNACPAGKNAYVPDVGVVDYHYAFPSNINDVGGGEYVLVTEAKTCDEMSTSIAIDKTECQQARQYFNSYFDKDWFYSEKSDPYLPHGCVVSGTDVFFNSAYTDIKCNVAGGCLCRRNFVTKNNYFAKFSTYEQYDSSAQESGGIYQFSVRQHDATTAQKTKALEIACKKAGVYYGAPYNYWASSLTDPPYGCYIYNGYTYSNNRNAEYGYETYRAGLNGAEPLYFDDWKREKCDQDNVECVYSAGDGLNAYDAFDGDSESARCLDCSRGTYSNAGDLACTTCPAGYSSGDVAASCDECTSGTISSSEGDVCEYCPAGYVKQGTTPGDIETCHSCPSGKYTDGNGGLQCNICPAGYSVNAVTYPFKIRNRIGSEGRFVDYEGSEEVNIGCEQCLPGQFKNTKSYVFQKGTVGVSEDWGAHILVFEDATYFEKCDPYSDNYNPHTGTGSPTNSQCPQADIYEFYRWQAYESCEYCSAGQYQDTFGKTACNTCAVGKAQSQLGQPGCIMCPTSHVSNATGATHCAPCATGKSTATTNGGICKFCPVGKTSFAAYESEHWYTNLYTEGSQLNLTDKFSFKDVNSSWGHWANVAVTYWNMSSCANTLCTDTIMSSSVLEAYIQAAGKTFGTGNRTDWYTSGDNCIDCPRGRYRDSGTPADDWDGECELCPFSMSTTETGATSVGDCVSCELGEYFDSDLLCKSCPSGTYSDKGQNDRIGLDSCTVCPTGKVSPNPKEFSSDACQNCPVGTYQNVTAGVAAEHVTCVNCTAGTEQPETGSTGCVDCTVGFFTDVVNGSNPECKACVAGKTSNTPVRGTSCKNCGIGSTTTGEGGPCVECAVGKFGDYPGLVPCKVCPAGKTGTRRGSFHAKHCAPCLPGKFSDGSGDGTCQDCPAGRYTEVGASTFCAEECPAGTFGGTGVSDVSQCQPCGFGRFSSASGATACDLCSGTTVPTDDSTGCADVIPPFKGTTSCAPGEYQDEEGQSGCKPCPAGFVSAAASGMCTVECPYGYETDGQKCSACPAGQEYDGSQCVSCPAGTFKDTETGVCTACSVGTFRTSDISSTAYQTCAVGTYQDEEGQTSCKNCLRNTGTEEGAVSSEGCGICPSGLASSAGSPCAACPEGESSDGLGGDCEKCAPGMYSDAGNCNACAGGKYQDEDGQTSCKNCAGGKWSNHGADVCVTCPGPDCFVCDPGYTFYENACVRCSDSYGGYVWDTFRYYDSLRYQHETYRMTSDYPGLYTRIALGVYNVTLPRRSTVAGAQSWVVSSSGSSGLGITSDGNFCRNCGDGEYWYTSGAAGQTWATYHCYGCPAGKSNVGGKTKGDPQSSGTMCNIKCAAGTYTDGTGGSCLECPIGTYSAQEAAGCTSCAQNETTTNTASGAPGDCYCPWPKKYFPGAANPCGVNECINAKTNDNNVCEPCGPGAYGAECASTCPAGEGLPNIENDDQMNTEHTDNNVKKDVWTLSISNAQLKHLQHRYAAVGTQVTQRAHKITVCGINKNMSGQALKGTRVTGTNGFVGELAQNYGSDTATRTWIGQMQVWSGSDVSISDYHDITVDGIVWEETNEINEIVQKSAVPCNIFTVNDTPEVTGTLANRIPLASRARGIRYSQDSGSSYIVVEQAPVRTLTVCTVNKTVSGKAFPGDQVTGPHFVGELATAIGIYNPDITTLAVWSFGEQIMPTWISLSIDNVMWSDSPNATSWSDSFECKLTVRSPTNYAILASVPLHIGDRAVDITTANVQRYVDRPVIVVRDILPENLECAPCPVGLTSYGDGLCIPCKPGFTSDGDGICRECPDGQTSDSDGICISCPDLFSSYRVQTGHKVCELCPLGHAYDAASGLCGPCPLGTFTNETGTRRENCALCASGDTAYSVFDLSCSPCFMPGETSTSGGVCTKCPAGKFNSGWDGQCSDCAVGMYNNETGQSTCRTCSAAGGYSDEVGLVNCKQCAVAKYKAPGMSSTSCAFCPAGKTNDRVGQSSCTDCSTGQYSLSPDYDLLTLRPNEVTSTDDGDMTRNYWAPVGATVEQGSARGTLLSAVKNGDMRIRIHTQNAINASEPFKITGIPERDYEWTGTLPTEIERSMDTFFAWSVERNAFEGGICKPCAAGTYSTHEGSSEGPECEHCPLGKYSDAPGEVCSDCEAGRYGDDTGLTSCKLCPRSTYLDTIGSARRSDCKSCPVGQYSDQQGNDNVGQCSSCLRGTFQDELLLPYTEVKSTGCAEGFQEISAIPYSSGATYFATFREAVLAFQNGAVIDTDKPNHWKLAPPTIDDVLVGFPFLNTHRILTNISNISVWVNRTEWVNHTLAEIPDISVGFPFVDTSRDLTQELVFLPWRACFQLRRGNNAGPGQPECKSCSVGQYQDQLGQTNCSLCPKGKSNGAVAQDSASDCLDCAVGKFAGERGQSQCKYCPSGHGSSDTGAEQCEPCAPGKFNDVDDQGVCKSCAAGQFEQESGSTGCEDCGAGTYSGSGQTACTLCPQGRWNAYTGKTACFACAAGMYQEIEGQTQCKECPPGTVTSGEGAFACADCEAGQYEYRTSSSRALRACYVCPDGKWQDEPAQTTCKFCATGKYRLASANHDVACSLDCAAGTYKAFGMLSCEDCPRGFYQNVEGAGACTECPTGFASDRVGQLTADTCQACPVGRSSFKRPGSSLCSECHYGTVGVAVGGVCQYCPDGKYNSYTGSTLCSACEPGFYQAQSAKLEPAGVAAPGLSADPSPENGGRCFACPNGYFADSDEAVECRLCPRGFYSEDGKLKSQCKQAECAPTVLVRKVPILGAATEDEACARTQCVPGSFQMSVSESASAYTCDACPAGQYQSLYHQTECLVCPSGQGPNAEATACTNCPAGKFSSGAQGCVDAIVGTFAGEGADSPTNCSANTGMHAAATSQDGCGQCPTGWASVSGLECREVTCPSHHWRDDHDICQPCASGTEKRSRLRNACTLCKFGSFSRAGFACRECPPGQGVNDVGLCEACPVGTYSLRSRCLECPSNLWSTTTGQTQCNQGIGEPDACARDAHLELTKQSASSVGAILERASVDLCIVQE